MKNSPLKNACLLLPFAAAIPASAATSYVENFTGFSNAGVTSFQVGDNNGQTISTAVGTTSNGVSSINGDSLFLNIDSNGGAGSYGGGLRTTINPSSLSSGDLTSSDPSDYNIVFDIQANGFTPVNVDLFLNIRDSTNTNVFGQISLNQNNAAFQAFIAQLNTNNTISVSLSLDEFAGVPADVSTLATADRFQFQINTRSSEGDYTAGANNVLVLDNVGITQVPEPTSALLLGSAGVFGLLRRRRG